MTCDYCLAAERGADPTALLTNGCVSCEGRALAAMGFSLTQVEAQQPATVTKEFERWAPVVRQWRAKQ